MTLPNWLGQRFARRVVRGVTIIAVGLAAGLASWPALAQEFVKVEDGARDQLPATPFLGAAYGFIWVAILVYVFGMAKRLARVQKELTSMRRRFERSDGDGPAHR